RSTAYLPGTTGITVGYNALVETGTTKEVVQSFPFALNLQSLIEQHVADPDLAKWLWQVSGISGFVILNNIGLPLHGATLYFVFSKLPLRGFGAFLALCVALTISEATFLGSEYDTFSLSGQLIYHARWYLFPLMSVAIWMLYQAVQGELRWPAEAWITIAG